MKPMARAQGEKVDRQKKKKKKNLSSLPVLKNSYQNFFKLSL